MDAIGPETIFTIEKIWKSGHQVATKWSPSDHQVVTKLSLSGHQVVTKWSPSSSKKWIFSSLSILKHVLGVYKMILEHSDKNMMYDGRGPLKGPFFH